MKKTIKIWTFTLIFLITILLIYFFIPSINYKINQMFFYLGCMDLKMIKEYILSFGALAPIVSFFLMVIQSIIAPIPAFLITLSNAAIFGWIKGAILSWSSSMCGAILCFYISKFLGRDIAEKLTSKFALKDIDKFFERYGKYTILIARLLPFISFDLISYGAGLTSIGFWQFFIGTGIGQLPATIIYSYVGGMLTRGNQLLMSGILILFSLTVAIYLLKKIFDNKRGKNEN